MKVISAVVLTGRGADKIMLQTDLPCATWPYNGNQSFSSEAASGSGPDYVRKHFGIEPRVINIDSANHKKD